MKKCILFFSILALILTIRQNSFAQVTREDYDALVALYNSTGGSSWYDKDNWNLSVNDVSDNWHGITVSGDRVVKIKLVDNNLNGKIPAEIANLTELKTLIIETNNLPDTIPAELQSLTKLETLSLNQNNLSGEIPEELSNLTNITELDLGSNNLEGSIPVELCQLTTLTLLHLYGNDLSDTIPGQIGQLVNLVELNLSDNQLTGEIPTELKNLTTLSDLNLLSNNLSGSIPAEIGEITTLTTLYLSENSLSDTIPGEIGNIANLTYLLLNSNALEGEIPEEIGNITNLENIDLRNNQLAGSVPKEIGTLNSLSELLLSDNLLSGTLPDELVNLTNLEELAIDNNQFTSIPDLSATAFETEGLQVANNLLTYESLEPNAAHLTVASQYSPQGDLTISPDEYNIDYGNELRITATIGGTYNQYLWYKGTEEVTVDANSNEYVDASMTDEDEGTYSCEVSNTLLPYLTFTSNELDVNLLNHAPVFFNNAIMDATEDISWSFDVSATDVEQASVTLAASEKPGWLTLTDNGNNSITLSGTPDNDDVGLNKLLITADDGIISNPIELILTFNVINVNDAPTNILLSSTGINENLLAGTVIAIISTEDVDVGDTHIYSFSDMIPNAENDEFIIVGDTLKSNAEFDFESQEEYMIGIISTDSEGESIGPMGFTITINNTNDYPTLLTISADTIAENEPVGTVVGIFSVVDPDVSDTHIYTFSTYDGIVDADNSSFQINGDTLKSYLTFDYETEPEQRIYIKVEDKNGGYLYKAFTIEVKDRSDLPTDISLSNASVNENEKTGTLVGEFLVDDPDTWDSHTFELVSGSGDTDNSRFYISGNELNELYTNEKFTYQENLTYSIRVKATDKAGNSTEKSLEITILNANDAPSALSISNTTIAENSSINTFVGQFAAIDLDNDALMYSLVTGYETNDADNDKFQVDGAKLKTNVVFNFEERDTFYIYAQVSDGKGGTDEEAFIITVTDVNDGPTDISLSATEFEENIADNSVVARISTTDDDTSDSHTYSLVSGNGTKDVDNDKFTISGNKLLILSSPDYEVQNIYSFNLQTSDSEGITYQKSFTLTVEDLNEAPEQINLSSYTINENQPKGTVVGELSAVDDDPEDTYTFGIIAGSGDEGEDNVNYKIDGNQLIARFEFNYETKSTHSIYLKTTDNRGLVYRQEIIINIGNINESPVLSLSQSTLSCYEAEELQISGITVSDPDVFDNLMNITLLVQNGALYLTNTSGITFISTETSGSTIEFEGTVDDMNNALSTLYYTSDDGYYGDDLLEITLSDKGNTGEGSELTVSGEIALTIQSVAPEVVTQPAPETYNACLNESITYEVIATGTEPLLYQWLKNGKSISGETSNTLTFESITEENNGNYVCKIENATGQTTTSNVVSLNVDPATLDISVVSVSCNGEQDGQILIDAEGGFGELIYLLDDETTETEITNLSAGTYTLEVIDESNCTVSEEVEVTQPDVLSAVANITDVLCKNGSTGVFTAETTGGTSPFSYKLYDTSGLLKENSTGIFSKLSIGTYTVKIDDVNGCYTETEGTINEPDILSVQTEVTDVACYNGTDGSIELEIMGGTAPYECFWSNTVASGTASELQTGTNTIDNSTGEIIADNYVLKISDNNGCSVSAKVQVKQPDEIEISLTKVSKPLCPDDATGKIAVTAENGTPSYTYSADGSDYQIDSLLTGLTAGDYTFYVKDANGCVAGTDYSLSSYYLLPVSDFDYISTLGAIKIFNYSTYAESMLWDFGDGTTYGWTYTPMEGTLIHLYAESGIYNITLITSNYCSSDTLTLSINISLVDIDDISGENNNRFLLSPNPNSGQFSIIENNSTGQTSLDYKIYNTAGQVVAYKNNYSTNESADVSSLPKGAYIVEIMAGEETYKLIMIKQE